MKKREELLGDAEDFFEKEQYSEIIDLLTNDLLEKHNHSKLYAWKARAYERLKQYEPAVEYAEKAILINSESPQPYVTLGNVWYSRKEYERAKKEFSSAIKHDGSFTAAYANRGLVYFELQEYDKAIEDYDKAILLDKDYPLTYYNKGLLFDTLKKHKEAVDLYSIAINLDPGYVDAYNNRGNAYLDLNDVESALKDFEKAIETDNSYALGYFNRGLIYENVKKYEDAINDFKSCLKLSLDKNDYKCTYAKKAIDRNENKIEYPIYANICDTIDAIKQLLKFEEECVTHYTTLSTAKILLLAPKSKFRLSEGAFLNDKAEGRTLFKFLNFFSFNQSSDNLNDDDTLAETFIEKPFIGSFVAKKKHNNLTLWRMYGKEGKDEAKGCALTLNRVNFLDTLQKENPSAGATERNEFTFYKVAYIDRGGRCISGSGKLKAELNILLMQLKEKVEESKSILDPKKKLRVLVLESLNEIAYLFKSVEYQYEHEVRLIISGIGFSKKIDESPRVYIELADIRPALDKITLGPKVERAEEWAAAFNYFIKENYNKKIEINMSHLPFK